MDHPAPACGHPLDRMDQELVRGGALPFRIGRREMIADVAVAQRPQNGVGQGVQTRVGVRMADQRLVMRDFHAAQPHRASRPPAVGVEAGADPGLHPRRFRHLSGDQGLGHGEILGEGQFHQAGIAGDQGDGRSRRAHDLGLVGRGDVLGPRGIGGAEGLQPEPLRRLRPPQGVAIDGLAHPAVNAAPQAVGHRQDGQGRVSLVERGQNPADGRRVQQGPGGVVDQHPGVVRRRQGGQTGPHRGRPTGPAGHREPAVQTRQRLCGHGLGPGRDDDRQFRRPGGQQGLGRPAQHGTVAQTAPLLGFTGAGPGSGGDDHGGEAHGPLLAIPRPADEASDRPVHPV